MLSAEVVHLGLEADGVVLQVGGLTHLLEVLDLVGLDLLLQCRQAIGCHARVGFQTLHALALFLALGLDGSTIFSRRRRGLGQARPPWHSTRSARPGSRQVRLQVGRKLALAVEGGLLGGDLLPGLGLASFLLVYRFFQPGQRVVQPLHLGFAGLRLRRTLGQVGPQAVEHFEGRLQLPAQLVILAGD